MCLTQRCKLFASCEKRAMKNIVLCTVALLLALSCNTDDVNGACGIPDGAIIDPITQTIYIELVDTNGNNLIANGTYNGLDITAEKDGFIIRPVVFDETQFSNLPESVKDIIVLPLFGEEDDNTWLLNLNENVTDTLVVNIKHGDPDACGFFLFEVLEVSYNEIEQDIEPFAVFDTDSKIDFKITVVK